MQASCHADGIESLASNVFVYAGIHQIGSDQTNCPTAACGEVIQVLLPNQGLYFKLC